MLRPQSLQTPEDGLTLDDRGPAAVSTPDPDAETPAEETGAEEELRKLKQRIETARKILPGPDGLHCRDCFARGRDAALRAIEGR